MRAKVNGKQIMNLKKFSQIIDLVGAMLVATGGTMLAIIPRIDLSLGGLMIAICGLILMDFNLKGSLGLNNFIEKRLTSASHFMGYCGFASCIFLGGGELLDIFARGQQDNIYEPGYIKVIANAIPYALGALLCFEGVRKSLRNIKDYMYIFLQISLFATGHFMIAVYGFRAGNSAYQIGTILFTGALLSMLAVVLANLKKSDL